MNVVVLIEGREAIPVRAIPLLANWRFMSPDTVAHVLAGTKDCNVSLLGDLQSNHILNGKVELMDRDWWTQFPLRELRTLSDKIETDEVSHEAGYSDWRKQSLKELPAGAFVWKDDYQKLHDKCWNYSNQTIHGGLEHLNSESEAQEADENVGAQSETQPKWTAEEWAEHIRVKEFAKESLEALERWREPRYSPFMLPELCEIVMEGFKQATPAEHQSAQNLLDERDQLIADINRWEAKDESKPSEALIKEEKLEIMRAKLAEIEGKIRVLRGDYLDSAEVPQSIASKTGLSQVAAVLKVDSLAKTQSVPTAPVFNMTKAAMIAQHKHEWTSIEGDMRDAASNGLFAAKAGARGWNEANALQWASAHNKLNSAEKPAHSLSAVMHNLSNLPAIRHTLKG